MFAPPAPISNQQNLDNISRSDVQAKLKPFQTPKGSEFTPTKSKIDSSTTCTTCSPQKGSVCKYETFLNSDQIRPEKQSQTTLPTEIIRPQQNAFKPLNLSFKKPIVFPKRVLDGNMLSFKREQRSKHSQDKKVMKEFNKKMSAATISKSDKKKRLNLIRQMNSRKYRYAAKMLQEKNQAFIDGIANINEGLQHAEISEELRKVQTINEEDEISSADEN